jgi:hypothetical protein
VNAQLEALIMLQDIDLMIQEMTDQKTASEMSQIGFDVNEVGRLREARDEVADKIDPELVMVYQRLMQRYPRAIVPVRNQVCLACFVKQPTKDLPTDAKIRTCQRCNRFLYYI